MPDEPTAPTTAPPETLSLTRAEVSMLKRALLQIPAPLFALAAAVAVAESGESVEQGADTFKSLMMGKLCGFSTGPDDCGCPDHSPRRRPVTTAPAPRRDM